MERDVSESLPDVQRGERAAHAIYGSIIVLALIVVEDGSSVKAGEMIAEVISAALITALAELYADYIGATIRARRHPTEAERRLYLGDIAIGFLTALIPVVYFVLAALDAIKLDVAFDAAIWTGVGIIGVYAMVANRLAGFTLARSVLVGLGFTLLGASLVALKAVF